jgi:hypothetical protein
MRSIDTSPEAERVQIGLLRRASEAQRVQLALALSDTMLQLAWRAIREAHPGASDEEVDLAFVEQCYGVEMAGRLRAYLRDRPQ